MALDGAAEDEMISMMPLLNDSEKAFLAAGRKVHAMRAYRERARIELGGRAHRPTLSGARHVVDAYLTLGAELGSTIPLAVEPELIEDIEEVEAQRRVLRERFEAYCRADGMDPADPVARASAHFCDSCRREAPKGEVLRGVYRFAADAMGWPTPVIFDCYACHGPLMISALAFDAGEG
jgi:hypothetical protein